VSDQKPRLEWRRLLEALRTEMERQGVIPKELAARLGCTVANVYQLFNVKSGLRFSTVERIAGALGLKLEIRLIRERGNPPDESEGAKNLLRF
jgi:transcriptional regulator with XRE-family HTH domain